MSQECKQTNGSWNDGLNETNLIKFHRHLFPSRRTAFKKNEFDRSRSMKGRLEIDSHDQALFDRNDAIILHPFDQQLKVEMSPRMVCGETRCFLSFLGS